MTIPYTSSFHLSFPLSPLKPKHPHHFITLLPKPLSLPPKLTDISKEDTSPSPSQPEPDSISDSLSPETEPFDSRRLEEKFAVLNTGIYECRSCGYKYDESVGDPSYPIAPGFQFQKLPEDWRCPTCGAAKGFFQSKSVEIAGFAQNQQFGLGGNSLTSGQKTLLIYGALLSFFALFLSGYFLQ
ncbi:PREDICTED: uncharacterized protein LOC109345778 isoform X2 [Lupinus angustifolius]|uniref:uncharacterized protein LOC109345778 isoform X2 n=1 Tax=Lupinus angustifolius TaxID=3871 RepID=UPI00092ECFC0|nr:PREDICTED: uncharacterized protein LOC109345778 isoform X2 [Lupinus angustifolius]